MTALSADPCAIADRVFSPCYIGGWNACEYWDLTDQVLRTIVVVTARKVRDREPVVQGTLFRVTVRSDDKLFGTTPVWPDQVRVQVVRSDPHHHRRAGRPHARRGNAPSAMLASPRLSSIG